MQINKQDSINYILADSVNTRCRPSKLNAAVFPARS